METAATLGGQTANFTVDDLGYTSHFLQECGLRFIQIVFVAVRVAGASAEDNALPALVRDEKLRQEGYYWQTHNVLQGCHATTPRVVTR